MAKAVTVTMTPATIVAVEMRAAAMAAAVTVGAVEIEVERCDLKTLGDGARAGRRSNALGATRSIPPRGILAATATNAAIFAINRAGA